MKQIYTTLALLICGFATPSLGQTNRLVAKSAYQLTATGLPNGGDSMTLTYNSQLQRCEQKNWELDNSETWIMKSRTIDWRYDSNGNLLYSLSQVGNDVDGWTNLGRSTYTYTADSKELSSVAEKWDGGNWVIEGSTYKEYGANGNLLSSSGIFGRNLYIYNAQGLLESKTYQQLTDGNWKDHTRYLYTYPPDKSEIATETIEFWKDSFWVNYYRRVYSYDANGNPLQHLVEKWEGMMWVNSTFISYAYDDEGYLLQALTKVWKDTIWENRSLFSQSYNSNHNVTFWLEQDWIAGAWEGFLREMDEYDATSNLQNTKLERWDGTSWILLHYGRYFYSELVSMPASTALSFEVFPNPASSSVAITGECLSLALVYDLKGCLVQQFNIHVEGERFQLGNLPTGNYLLQVFDNDGKTGAKPLQIRR